MWGSIAVFALVAVLGVTGEHVCPVARIPRVAALNEASLVGTWYEDGFYYSTRYSSPPTYTDYTLTIVPAALPALYYAAPTIGAIRVLEQYRTGAGVCKVGNDAVKTRLGNAEYTYNKKGSGISPAGEAARFIVVEADPAYQKYVIFFQCLEKNIVNGDCKAAELEVYCRNKIYAPEAIQRLQHLVRGDPVLRGCIHTPGGLNRLYLNKQTSAGSCPALGLGGIYGGVVGAAIGAGSIVGGSVPGYYYGGINPYGIGSNIYQFYTAAGTPVTVPGAIPGAVPGTIGAIPGAIPGIAGAIPGTLPVGTVPGAIPGVLPGVAGYDADYIRVLKEKLIAEKEALMVEKEMQELMREKLRLENDILRRGGTLGCCQSGVAGVPRK